jgi:DNA-binding GntR family transcriptional regulator
MLNREIGSWFKQKPHQPYPRHFFLPKQAINEKIFEGIAYNIEQYCEHQTKHFPVAISKRRKIVRDIRLSANSPLKEKPARKQTKQTKAISSDEVHAKLQQAIFEHRLKPGTKLIEERLAEVVGLSRTIIRPVLARLAHERLVTLIPNRGAFIASPTVREAREVFVTRRLIEPEVVKLLAASATAKDVERMRAHVEREALAREKGDRPTIIRLSGEFHLLLAELQGNQTLLRIMREMCAQTCLVIALYDSPNTPSCTHDEHMTMVDAIERHDGNAAAACMLAHLNHIEQTLNFDLNPEDVVDWHSIFY